MKLLKIIAGKILKLFGRGEIHYLGGNDILPPPLTPEEETEVINSIKTDEANARRKLIEHNLRLVVYIARKFDNTKMGIEDLISIGTIGLIKAINTFNPDKNIKLATYASRCIENEILMCLRKNAGQKNEVSIDEPLNVDWDGNELLLSDILSVDENEVHHRLEERAEREMLLCAMGRLSKREKEIINMRFGLGGYSEKTQKEVADMLGISQSYISRLEKRIIKRLQNEISKMAKS